MNTPDSARLGSIVEELARASTERRMDRIALAIAAREYGAIDLKSADATLEGLADRVRDRLSGDEGPSGIVASISQSVCREAGFHINSDDYYDPRNSYLTDVLDRRLGIPVTLAVVFHEVARRVGFAMFGVGVPARFMLGYRGSAGSSLVDVAAGGTIVTETTVRKLAERDLGREINWNEHSVSEVAVDAWARRILNNLFRIAIEREEYDRALRIADDMDIVLPTPEVTRDRGLILLRLRRWLDGEAALSKYLDISPNAPDRDPVRQQLAAARARLSAQ